MARYINDIDEIHRIIFDAPSESEDSSDFSELESDVDEIEDENEEETMANSGSVETTGGTSNSSSSLQSAVGSTMASILQIPHPNQKQTIINWGPLDQSYDKDYPVFTGPEHGPTREYSTDSDPVVFFDQLFTDELWELLVEETNRFARQNKTAKWTDTTKDELRCFVGFLYGTSINKISQIDDVWSSDWVVSNPAFAKFFNRDRFWALFSNIHLANNELALPKDHCDYDKIYKLRPMVNILKNSFQKNYNLGHNVSVDEAMVKGKGRNPLKQYLPNKPIKRGSKLWCIGCSCCAYLWDFNIYTGKSKKSSDLGLASRVVIDLCHPSLYNRGHVVYIDNFFSSLSLCKQLETFGIYTAGTLRINRKGYPLCLKEKNLLKSMKRGDYHTASADGITITIWKDTKDVSFITNCHSSKGQETVSRKKKKGSRVIISAPPVLKDYNNNMGAIDKNDQLKKTYAIDRKSRRWWLRIFFHLLDICRVNAYIIYQQCFVQWNSGPMDEDIPTMMTQKEFTSKLVKSLCGSFSSRKALGRPPNAGASVALVAKHYSVNIVKRGILKRGRCYECSVGPNKKYDRVETVYGCEKCVVRLCRDKCHSIYHARLQGEDIT